MSHEHSRTGSSADVRTGDPAPATSSIGRCPTDFIVASDESTGSLIYVNNCEARSAFALNWNPAVRQHA
jgi:hypothetical protein